LHNNGYASKKSHGGYGLMAIPDFQKIMLPLLKFLEDKIEHSIRETIDSLADQFDLSEEERRELLPSGQQAIFSNRVG
jgi:restriction system protein